MAVKTRIAVVSQAVKLPGEKRGLDRIAYVCSTLTEAGYDVTLFTSTFQHWEKAKRETWRKKYRYLPYKIVFLDEPGYSRNIEPKRIVSHARFAENLEEALEEYGEFDLVYSLVPPNDMARVAGNYAKRHFIPFVVDVSDLWPEAMKMALDVPVLSDLAFLPFSRDAKAVYKMADAAIGTSDEYALRPLKDNPGLDHITVYVGNDLARFDAYAEDNSRFIEKPENEIWVTYAGSLGKSYDINTFSAAVKLANDTSNVTIKGKVLGDGPDRASFEEFSRSIAAPVDFLGYADYENMCAYLVKSDILVNSLIKSAPQSIVSKIADYLAAGRPMINTGLSHEFRSKVDGEGFGLNVSPENVSDLAAAIVALAESEEGRDVMGENARKVAEDQFDRPKCYQKIVELADKLTRKE